MGDWPADQPTNQPTNQPTSINHAEKPVENRRRRKQQQQQQQGTPAGRTNAQKTKQTQFNRRTRSLVGRKHRKRAAVRVEGRNEGTNAGRRSGVHACAHIPMPHFNPLNTGCYAFSRTKLTHHASIMAHHDEQPRPRTHARTHANEKTYSFKHRDFLQLHTKPPPVLWMPSSPPLLLRLNAFAAVSERFFVWLADAECCCRCCCD